MNYLKHFIELIQEGQEYDEQDIKNMTIEMSDLGAEVEIRKGYFNLDYFSKQATSYLGSYHFPESPKSNKDVESFLIIIKTNLLPQAQTNSNGTTFGIFTDKSIYEVLGVIIEIANRTENCYFSIYQNANEGLKSFRFLLYVPTKKVVGGTDEEFFMDRLFAKMKHCHNQAKSDFANDITMKLNKTEIIVTCGADYTKNKFERLFGNALIWDGKFCETKVDDQTYVSEWGSKRGHVTVTISKT